MFTALRKWLDRKWVEIDASIARDYMVAFSTPEGQRVLQHMLDGIYNQVYEGKNRNEAVMLNARRSVIHEILINIDVAEHPEKYKVRTAEETLEEILENGRRDPS